MGYELVKFRYMPCSIQKCEKLSDMYSPPSSLLKALILWLEYVSANALYSLNLEKV